MIGTHHAKMFNARLQQSGICATLLPGTPEYLISSASVSMGRQYWAIPQNAAKMGVFRKEIETNDFCKTPVLPKIGDSSIKQILLPYEWNEQQYVSTSPVPSLGVLHEVWNRLQHTNVPNINWIIQPNIAAIANHGEALLLQSGRVRLLRRGVSKIELNAWGGRFVQLTARVESMNISSGMVAVGFPSIASIGGLVHSLERKAGCKIDFAFGFNSMDWNLSLPRVTSMKSGGDAATLKRLRKNASEISLSYALITEEITATGEIVLLLRSDKGCLNAIAEAAKEITRIAGGSVFDETISICENSIPKKASFLLDASRDIKNILSRGEAIDTLDAALHLYGDEGEWQNGKWYQPRNGYTLNASGYAFLEEPQNREATRGNYPHVWSEPVFNLVTQGSMTKDAWWSRKNLPNGVFWMKKT